MTSPKIIELPKYCDKSGSLSVIEEGQNVPFDIKRVFWIYDVPGGESRGGHAYKTSKELIIALSGSFDIHLDDGTEKMTFHLNRSYYGLYVPQGMWREMDNFSTNSVAMVVSSSLYSEEDYIRDYDEYKKWKDEKK